MSDPDALIDQTCQALGEDGVVLASSPGFCVREGQLTMAEAVAQIIVQGGTLVVEAGTGTGKTFAYLVPALLSGRRTLVSTATKALQDQLFGRDLPRLLAMLRLPVRVALLKGRANYLCPHRLDLHLNGGLVADGFVLGVLRRVRTWARTSTTGDLSLMPGLDGVASVTTYFTSTRENCLGSACPQWSRCPLQAARREALAADLVVVNHHLFFADVAVRESGVAELLPKVDLVIFDEAHQLNDIGVQFLGVQLGAAQLLDLSRDVLVAGLQHARGLVDWTARCASLELAVRELRLVLGATLNARRLPWAQSHPQGIAPQAWAQAVAALREALESLSADLQPLTDRAPDLGRLAERLDEALARLAELQDDAAPDQVLWLDVGKQWRWVRSPLDCASAFASASGAVDDGVVQAKQAAGEVQTEAAPRSWVFTSATLGDEPQLRWFCQPLGLRDARVVLVPSPFDHAAQAALWVPPDLPLPSDTQHTAALVQRALPWVRALGGRTLFLTTTLRALQAAAVAFRQTLQDTAIEVLVQGELAKVELLARFAAAAPAHGALLIASVSFWEGVDLPGDMLQLVILDKLPFPVPDDPVVKARTQRLERGGESSFAQHTLPATALALKQGAGRLIRSESDRGLLVIGDVRLLRKSYGRRLLGALPPMRVLRSQQQLDDWLRCLSAAPHGQTWACRPTTTMTTTICQSP